jgi:chaperone modulatory protein CbpM
MTSHELPLVHIGSVIEEDVLTLGQLCRVCSVHADWVISLVEEGIIEPEGKEVQQWRFSGGTVVRVRSASRLQHDLGVNLAGIGLALDLMDELENLRSQLHRQGLTGDDLL